MGCRKLAYYEKPASPLRVLPENDEVTVIVVYSIRYDNEKVVQGWFTPDPAEQFSNPYLAMGNNPVMYTDPNGEFAIIAAGIIAAEVLLSAVTITATVSAATVIAAGVTIAGTATGIALAASSYGSAVVTPPHEYLYDPAKPNQRIWIGDKGGTQLDYYTNIHTNETITRVPELAVKNPMAELGNEFANLATEMRTMYQLNHLPSLPAGPLGPTYTAPALQTGVSALGPTPAAASSSGWGMGSGVSGFLGSGAGLMADDYSRGWNKYTFGNNFWYGGQHGVYRGVPLNQVPTPLRTAGILKGVGHGFGAVGYGFTVYDHSAGGINDLQFGLETASSAYSALGGLYGNAWGLGWELGRAVTSVPGYHEYFRVPMQRMLGLRR